MSLATFNARLRGIDKSLGAIEAPPEMSTIEEREKWTYPQYADDPEGFCHEVLGESITEGMVLRGDAASATAPWAKQVEIMESVRDNQRTVVKACHSVGKTHIAARVAGWYLYTRSPCIVITTAPKATQVRDLLWGRFRAMWSQTRLPLHGECLLSRCEPIRHDPEWYAVGYTARDAEGFQGYHEAHVLIIFDEAPGVPPFIYDAVEGIMSTENVRWLGIGNPTERSGHFYRANVSPLYNSIHISAYDHPNVVHGRALYSKAVAPGWPAERLQEWGEKHPLYLSRVMGEFPDEGEDTLIPLSWIESAVDRSVSSDGDKLISCDVARFGLDETVFYLLQGRLFDILEKYVGKDTVATAGRLIRWKRSSMADLIVIDDVGVGGGVTDQVKDQLPKEERKTVVAFNAGERAKHPDEFFNLGSEAWWCLRLAFEESYKAQQGGSDDLKVGLSIPNDPVLIGQLAGRKYDVTSKGLIKVESKKDMAARGEPSPDRADALTMGWFGRVHRPPRVTTTRVRA